MDFIQKNIRLIILFGILYILTIIILLYFIWNPNKDELPEFASYTEITQSQVDKKVMKQYMDNLILAYSTYDIDYLFDICEDNFLKQEIGDIKAYQKYLEEEGMFTTDIHVNSVTKYVEGTNVVYAFNVSFQGIEKRINIIETYGENIQITYGEYYSKKDIEKKVESGDVQYNIKKIYRNINSLEMILEISNGSSEDVFIPCENSTNVRLILENNNVLVLNNIKTYGEDKVLSAGNTIEKKLIFNISLDKQTEIQKLELLNIKIGEKNQKISIDFGV